MSDPYHYDEGPADKPDTNGAAVAGGIVLAFALIPFCLATAPVGVVFGVVVAFFAVFLITRADPVARGFGVGLLIGGAIAGILVATCFAMFAGID